LHLLSEARRQERVPSTGSTCSMVTSATDRERSTPRQIEQSFTRKDRDRDILALCDIGATWSPRGKADAIRDIGSGQHTYHVPWPDGRTEIRVVHGSHGKYLRTDHDNTQRNNLDDLPDC